MLINDFAASPSKCIATLLLKTKSASSYRQVTILDACVSILAQQIILHTHSGMLDDAGVFGKLHWYIRATRVSGNAETHFLIGISLNKKTTRAC